MSQQKPEDDISVLAGAADASIRGQQEKAAALAATPPKRPVAKQILTILLLVAFVVIAWIQYPRFNEPFGHPDPTQDPAVAEADLNLLATLLESYRLSQGKYPTTLDEVHLPDAIAAFVAEQKITYRQTDKAYVLDWTLPRWHALFNGETRKVDISATKRDN